MDVKANVTTSLLARLGGLTTELVKMSPGDLQLHVDLDQIEAIAAQPEVVFVQPQQRAFTSRMGPSPAAGRLTPRDAACRGGERRTQGAPPTGHEPRRHGHRIRQLSGGCHSPLGGLPWLDWIHGRRREDRRALRRRVHLAADAQASGDLGTVTVLPGQTGSGDEGTAMLELIHDMAPGAQLYFATAFTSITSFAQNIRDLRTAGCDIIVDDVGYFVETPFQDGQGPTVVSTTNGGVVIQAVKDVTAAGALYFSSAGNSGNLNDGTSGVWEGNYVLGAATTDPPIPGAGAGNFHTFTAGQDFDTLTVAGSGPINLFWSDPLGGSGNDYDLFRLNTAGTVGGSPARRTFRAAHRIRTSR